MINTVCFLLEVQRIKSFGISHDSKRNTSAQQQY